MKRHRAFDELAYSAYYSLNRLGIGACDQRGILPQRHSVE